MTDLDPREAEMKEHERRCLRARMCPWSGDRLTAHGNVQIPAGTLSCGVCDCFGYNPSEVGKL